MYFSDKAVVETLGFFAAAASPLLLNFHLFPSSHVQFRVVLESSSGIYHSSTVWCKLLKNFLILFAGLILCVNSWTRIPSWWALIPLTVELCIAIRHYIWPVEMDTSELFHYNILVSTCWLARFSWLSRKEVLLDTSAAACTVLISTSSL